jgi:hypothetical protein
MTLLNLNFISPEHIWFLLLLKYRIDKLLNKHTRILLTKSQKLWIFIETSINYQCYHKSTKKTITNKHWAILFYACFNSIHKYQSFSKALNSWNKKREKSANNWSKVLVKANKKQFKERSSLKNRNQSQ